MIRRLGYSSSEPPPMGVAADLLGRDDFVHVTATLGQAKRRDGARVLHAALRDVLQFRGVRVYSRSAERVLLLRAASSCPDEVRRLVAQDADVWLDALRTLDEEGVVVSDADPTTLEGRVRTARLRTLLATLQNAWLQQHDAHGGTTFERAARILVQDPRSWLGERALLMEGFTFFRPLQEVLVRRCSEQDVDLVLMHPWNPDQALGFESVQLCHREAGIEMVHAVVPAEPHPDALRGLQASLFGTPVAFQGRGGVELTAYADRCAELRHVVTRVGELVHGGADPRRIAIVARAPDEFRATLIDEAERLEARGRVIPLRRPRRNLLLTPIGRFILRLYHSWDADRATLAVDAVGVEEVLASGWLGETNRATLGAFRLARAQYFEGCRSREQWQRSLERLKQEVALARDPGARCVEAFLSPSDVDAWMGVIATLERLAARLYGGGDASIGQHVRALSDQLASLIDDKTVLAAESALVRSILDALLAVHDEAAFTISSQEFSELVVALASADPSDEEAEEQEDESNGAWATVRIVSYESVDGMDFDHVFLVGTDDARVPRIGQAKWPLRDRHEHVRRPLERYFFLAAIRSAKQTLSISWSESGEDERYSCSPYVEDVARILGIAVPRPTERADRGRVHGDVRHEPSTTAREIYRLSDLAVYARCPARYWFERVSPDAAAYGDLLQVRWVAQSELVRASIQRVADERWRGSPSALRVRLRLELEGLKSDVLGRFSHLGAAEQTVLSEFANRALALRADLDKASESSSVRVLASSEHSIQVRAYRGVRRILMDSPFDIEIDGERSPFATPTLVGTWMAKSYGDSRDTGWKRHAEWLAMPGTYRTRGQLAGAVDGLESGRFPKHPTAACRICPAWRACMRASEEVP